MKLLTALFVLAWVLYAGSAQADLNLACQEGVMKDLTFFKPVPTVDPCNGAATSLVAITSTNVLYLCENSRTVGRYDVSLGRGGLDKTARGDNKTPIGTYTLGLPRESDQFGLFIPVGYPSASQRAEGMTGSDVGIHGPERALACLGLLNVVINWTQGCLAVADDHMILEIANFVRTHRGLQIHILR